MYVRHPSGLSIRMHTAGRKLYGNAWNAARPGLVRAFTRGREDSSKRMTHDEMLALCEHMEASMAWSEEHRAPHAGTFFRFDHGYDDTATIDDFRP